MSFATDLTALKNSITTFISLMNGNYSKNVVNANVNIPAGTLVSYDLQTLLGSNHALYDKKRARIIVRVKDTIMSSPTLNMYINSEAVAVVAIDSDRYVRVYNQHSTALDFYISVDVPKI